MRENLQISTQILDPFSLLLWFLVGFAKNAHMHACMRIQCKCVRTQYAHVCAYIKKQIFIRNSLEMVTYLQIILVFAVIMIWMLISIFLILLLNCIW